MSDTVEQLARAFERFPGVGQRQTKRFVYYLLAAPASERAILSELIATLTKNVRQCSSCFRFWSGAGELCGYCSDRSRNNTLLMIVEKDQDIVALERTNTYRGHYFVLGGVLSLSGKGAVRGKELLRIVDDRLTHELQEIILAFSATSEGEHTADYIRELLTPYRSRIRISILGRGIATGNELEYLDAETLSGALINRKES